MNRAKIALNQRALSKLERRGIVVHSRVPLIRDDGITHIVGLELVELDRKFVRTLDGMRKNGDTYSHVIQHQWGLR